MFRDYVQQSEDYGLRVGHPLAAMLASMSPATQTAPQLLSEPAEPGLYTCAFCGRMPTAAGLSACICQACTDLCREVFSQRASHDASAPEADQDEWLALCGFCGRNIHPFEVVSDPRSGICRHCYALVQGRSRVLSVDLVRKVRDPSGRQ
jgi:hypothetical protein